MQYMYVRSSRLGLGLGLVLDASMCQTQDSETRFDIPDSTTVRYVCTHITCHIPDWRFNR